VDDRWALKSKEILSHRATKDTEKNKQKFWEKSLRKNPFSKGFVSTEQDAKGKIYLMTFFVPFISSW
jgi:hypothetical protein